MRTFIVILLILLLNNCTKNKITFFEHIAPIIHTNCTPCHRPNQSAPFALISYKDISKRSKMINYVTDIGYMPPWPADPNYSNFIGEKHLTKSEIFLIKKWIEEGLLIGDSSKYIMPIYPKLSQISSPDTVIKFPSRIDIKGNNQDKFLMARLILELPRDTFIRAIEFVPGNKERVHHLNSHFIIFDDIKKHSLESDIWFTDTEILEDTSSFKILKLFNDDGSYPTLIPLVSNYLPGVLPTVYPAGIGGYKLGKKNIILINDLHYGPSPIDTFDKSYFNLFYDSIPPQRPTREIQLGTLGISKIIPPLIIPVDTIMEFKTEAVVVEDISVLTINPHMHLLGKSIISYAITENLDTINLIKINQWKFKWQYFYTFKKMIKIPKGSTIIVKATYDNTSNNPNNPNNPPKRVTEKIDWDGKGSMRSTDEMLQFIITYLPYKNGDENISLENHYFN